MIIVQVHHNQTGSALYEHVANVSYQGEDVEHALDYAWERTQNIDGSWSRGITYPDGQRNADYSAHIERLAPLPVYDGKTFGLRSSMVGDRFVIEGVGAWKVAGCGFEKEAA
jgi:hypothetical protein